mmetsp:Transcript_85904/g.205882  ORF Transcript_85904/g.205882 Transcript_85904/m.205882 type:complete len:211 (-) Transcript_85904:1038-1670(-)
MQLPQQRHDLQSGDQRRDHLCGDLDQPADVEVKLAHVSKMLGVGKDLGNGEVGQTGAHEEVQEQGRDLDPLQCSSQLQHGSIRELAAGPQVQAQEPGKRGQGAGQGDQVRVSELQTLGEGESQAAPRLILRQGLADGRHQLMEVLGDHLTHRGHRKDGPKAPVHCLVASSSLGGLAQGRVQLLGWKARDAVQDPDLVHRARGAGLCNVNL